MNNRVILLIIIILSFTLVPKYSLTQSDPLVSGDLSLVNTISRGRSNVHDLEASGNYLYVADGLDGLRIYNAQSPNLILLSTLSINGFEVWTIELYQNYIFLGLDTNGLAIVNVTDVNAPELISIQKVAYSTMEVRIDERNNLAYVLGASYDINPYIEVSTVNISNFNQLSVIDTIKLFGKPESIEFGFTHLFVAAGFRYYILDLVDNSHPQLAVELDVTGFAVNSQVVGNQLFVGTWSYIQYYDITNISAPIWKSSYAISSYQVNHFLISGQEGYLSGVQTFERINVSDPLNMTSIETYTVESTLRMSVVSPVVQGEIIAAGGEVGIHVFNVFHHSWLNIGQYSNQFNHLQVKDNLLVIASKREGMLIYDINGTFLSSYDNRTEGFGYISIRNDVVMLAGAVGTFGPHNYLQFINISDPQQPSFIKQYPVMNYPYDVATQGQYIYLALGWAGFKIIDMQDMNTSYSFDNGNVDHIRVTPDHILTSFRKELSVYSPLSPIAGVHSLYNITSPGNIYDFYENNGYLYISDDIGLQVYNISDSMSYLGYYSTHPSYSMMINNNLLYSAMGPVGFEILEISNPLNITRLASFNYVSLNWPALELEVRQDLIYLANGIEGVTILQFNDTREPITTKNPFVSTETVTTTTTETTTEHDITTETTTEQIVSTEVSTIISNRSIDENPTDNNTVVNPTSSQAPISFTSFIVSSIFISIIIRKIRFK